MKKIFKANKEHVCNSCGGIIRKGEKYILFQIKLPKYANDGETQTGIQYITTKTHNRNCCNDVGLIGYNKEYLKYCVYDIHEIVQYSNPDSCGDGFCCICGKPASETYSKRNRTHNFIR